jgi:ADP-ribose pyrophosphatase
VCVPPSSAPPEGIPVAMSRPHLQKWRILGSEYRVDTKFLRLRADRVELPDGTVVEEYFVRESRGFSVVLAITSDGLVPLVRQYKHGAGEILLELPAGMIDPGEDPATCAARELAEETGFTGAPPEHVRTLYADPTNATTAMHLYVVRDARRTREPVLDVTEAIELELVTPQVLQAMAYDGRIAASSQVAAVLLALAYLERG